MRDKWEGVDGEEFQVVEFDDVINKQRETIYEERDKVLRNEDLTDTIQEFVDSEIDAIVASAYQEAEDSGLVVPLHADEAVPNPSDQARPKVRALRRPPVPFSRGTQPAFLEQ